MTTFSYAPHISRIFPTLVTAPALVDVAPDPLDATEDVACLEADVTAAREAVVEARTASEAFARGDLIRGGGSFEADPVA